MNDRARRQEGKGQRDWTVLLIGGGVGAGKSTLSFALAEHFGVRAIEGDLFRLVLTSTIPYEVAPDLVF